MVNSKVATGVGVAVIGGTAVGIGVSQIPTTEETTNEVKAPAPQVFTVGDYFKKEKIETDESKGDCKAILSQAYSSFRYRNAKHCEKDKTFQERAEKYEINVLKEGVTVNDTDWTTWWTARKTEIKGAVGNTSNLGDDWTNAKAPLLKHCQDKGKTIFSEEKREDWKKYITACNQGNKTQTKNAQLKEWWMTEKKNNDSNT